MTFNILELKYGERVDRDGDGDSSDCWLEATLELMSNISEGQSELQLSGEVQKENVPATNKAYRELQEEMAAIHSKGQNIKEDIENIKTKFLTLLDLCGIKDADIPLFDEPDSVSHNHQTLITSFGIMSKSPSHSTPQRSSRHARRDPSIYADLLIEQLLAQASSITDSSTDTSPPSAEESAANVIDVMTVSQPQSLTSNNNNDDKLIPLQLNFESPSTPQSLLIAQLPSTSEYQIPPNSEAGEDTEDQMEGQQVIDIINHEDDGLDPLPASQMDPERLHHYATDSGLTDSSFSHRPVTYLSKTSSLVNATTGSTPELPTSESSDSLDIPFASLFDHIEYPGQAYRPSDFNISQNPASPVLPQVPLYHFPARYSHSYAQHIHVLESGALPPEDHPAACATDLTNTAPPQSSSTSCHPKEHLSPLATKTDKQFQFLFHQPLVVCLPPKSESGPRRPSPSKLDVNIDKVYKPHIGDKNAGLESDNDDRPPIPPRRPLTDTKVGTFFVQSESTEVGSLWLSSESSRLQTSQERDLSYVQRSVSDDIFSQSQCEEMSLHHKHFNTPCRTGNSDFGSPQNISWSYHDLPSISGATQYPMTSMSTGKAHYREKHRRSADRFITVRFQQPPSPSEASVDPKSASKRRKGNDKTEVPTVQGKPRSARQRLSFTPVSSPTRTKETVPSTSEPVSSPVSVVSSLGTSPSRSSRLRKKKRVSPAMRRLIQLKENNILSPTHVTKSPRRPFSQLYNIQLNDSDALTTSSNSLTPSSEAYAKSSETSPDLPLPSREEELLDRDAYYCDFTVDRQNKIDALAPRQLQAFSTAEESEGQYTAEDPVNSDILVRRVEGAESSPSSFVFQPPPSNLRAPRTRGQNSVGTKPNSKSMYPTSASDRVTSRRTTKARSSSNTPSSRHTPLSSCHSPTISSKNSSPTRSRSSSCSSRSSRKKCTTHPMASSTLLMDESTCLSPEIDTASVYTWSIDEESSPCNLEKSYIRSTSSKKKRKQKKKLNTPRPPTSVGRDSPKNLFDDLQDTRPFEITAMVSRIDETMNKTSLLSGKQVDSMCEDATLGGSTNNTNGSELQSSIPRTSTRSTLSGKCILAAAPSLLKTMNMSKSRNSHSSEAYSGQYSNFSSNQATTSSVFFNRAKASIVCSSTETSDIPEHDRISYDRAHSRHISASEPNLRNNYIYDEEDATHSLVPSDTDSTPEIVSVSESSAMEDRLDIPGKSSTSGSSSCTAARCRPRVLRRSPEKLSEAAGTSEALAGESQSHPNQDLLDSILTDSPKSVDSSGIFAPYNSYNSPVESVGSHNGYSSTVSSSVTSSDTNYNRKRPGFLAPPPTPPHTRGDVQKQTNTCTFVGKSNLEGPSQDVEFKRPFTPAPHVNHTLRPLTRNQGVTAESNPPTPHRPMSVRSDPLGSKSVFAVPPGVVTGPPKIKDKKSLVKKFKKFSSNFYKKTEKIQTLANL